MICCEKEEEAYPTLIPLCRGRVGFDGGIAVDKEGRVQLAGSLAVEFPAEWSQDLPWSAISLMSPS